MIHEFDSDHFCGFGHAAREQDVLGVRRRVAAWMGVEEDEAGGAAEEALLEDLAGFDGGPVECAAEDLLMAEEAAAVVQEDGSHQLLVALLVVERQETRDVVGSSEGLAVRDAPVNEAAGELAGREESRNLVVAEAGVPEGCLGGVGESGEATANIQERLREAGGVLVASCEQATEELRVRERVRMVSEGIRRRAVALGGAVLVRRGLGRFCGGGGQTEGALGGWEVGERPGRYAAGSV
ncbi:MAG TPA: hypothetical protein VN999_11080 [Thermoanaerobaculia bacterium]|nr:hypothetical protein [Thermoanaerobaculia bacterium]